MNDVAERHPVFLRVPFMHLPGMTSRLQPGRGPVDGELLHSDDKAAMCRTTVSDEGAAVVARAPGSFRHLDLAERGRKEIRP